MTLIANPIYDIVFKFLMEDNRVAKILLSALLKKEIIDLEMRQHEYTAMKQSRISLFRIDFCAKIREEDGEEHLVLIELQKTWLATETLRFRQYLGTQYLNKDTMKQGPDKAYGLPIISIYILGHILGDLEEPVVYVSRRYLDYDNRVLEKKDPFIESLTHDSVIVQIPYLKGRVRNHLERLLNLFDQDYRKPDDEHYLEIDEDIYTTNDEQFLMLRLVKAAASPEVRRAMDVEDEILSEIEARDTLLMQKDEMLEKKDEMLEKKDAMLEEKDALIEGKDAAIEEEKALVNQMIEMLTHTGMTPELISGKLRIPLERILEVTKKS